MRIILTVTLTLGLTALASANVWIDEDFDDGSPWTQGTGVFGAVPGANLDTYAWSTFFGPIVSPFGSILTATGSVVTSKQFTGTSSYRLQPGQTIAVGEPYESQTNGSFCYLQFAVNVDPIPAAGDVGAVTWEMDRSDGITTPTYSYTTKLVSTGSAVNIMAGQTTGTLAQIGTLTSINSWKLITMRLQNGDALTTDPHAVIPVAEQGKTPGVYFYCTSATPAHTEPITTLTGLNPKRLRAVAFTCATGAIYIDSLYYDGGMEDPAWVPPSNSGLQAFDYVPSTAAENWQLY